MKPNRNDIALVLFMLIMQARAQTAKQLSSESHYLTIFMATSLGILFCCLLTYCCFKQSKTPEEQIWLKQEIPKSDLTIQAPLSTHPDTKSFV